MAKSKGSLVLSPATLEDLPVISTMFPRSYHNSPFFKKMLPDTPANEKWWQESHRIALHDPLTRVVKVTDQGNGEIVGLVRWVLPREGEGPQPGSEKGRWPEFTDDVDKTLSGPMFGFMAQRREEVMGDKRHYCTSESQIRSFRGRPHSGHDHSSWRSSLMTITVLELIETVGEYKGRGAGSLMMRYGCDMADKDGLEIYVDSSMEGYPMYLKYGFVVKAEEPLPGGFDYIQRHLVRPPRRDVDKGE